MKDLNNQIRQVKQQLMDNLDSDFNPIDVTLDSKLEIELEQLYKQRKQLQTTKIDTLSDMYLRVFAWSTTLNTISRNTLITTAQ